MSASSPVDLRSDTVTRPTPEMRRAIAAADVGDDALGDDPTVVRLEARTAELLRKEAALFFPSGIMANQAAIHVLAPRATEVVVEASAHVLDWEDGAPAAWSGVLLRAVPAPDGMLTAALVRGALRPASPYRAATSLICLENTHNAAGGRVLPLESMRAIRAEADQARLPIHLDGARLWNATAATGVAEHEYAACADTVMVTLSKGLGCPVGSLLAGTAELVARARRVRRRLGGTMRQAGILAAAGLYALEHHRQRLRDDHRRARRLAAAIEAAPGARVFPPETNIVMVELPEPLDSATAVRRARDAGVLASEFGPRRIRLVTHLDIDDDAVERAGEAIVRALARAGSRE